MSERQVKEKHTGNEVSGFRIRSLNYTFIIAIAILAIILFTVTMTLSAEYADMIRVTDDYHQIEMDAHNVQNASDDLTRDVQYFVMTGKRMYMDSYFQEANVTRRREKAMDDLSTKKATDELFKLLEDAVNESMTLMLLEYDAFRYAAEGYGFDIESLPEEVKNTVLPKSAQSMSPEEKIKKAQEIVFGEEYNAYKSRISGDQKKYLEEAIVLLDQMQAEGRVNMGRLLLLERIGIVIIVILGAVLFVAISRMIVQPLNRAVSSMAGGESIFPLDGTYEIQFMSHTYNGYHRDNMDIQKKLKQVAERDALTGVLNRRGYLTVVDKLQTQNYPLALLIVDVDRFKDVNDTYGHTTGDEALKKVARILRETFRSTDITSRIGGDEFTVIMSDITSNHKEVIEGKVRMLNDELQRGTDAIPSMTVSVGCAFSMRGFSNELFANADAQMYESKKEGLGLVHFA